MSCYLIKVENGHKVARSINTEEEYRALRNGDEQRKNLLKARNGNQSAKRSLVQFNYSGHYPDGVVKGSRLPSMAFGFDIDNKEDFERVATMLLASPQSYGLLMLERSVNQGGHAVLSRERGKTILENQVRIASLLHCEMDTNAHDINRVYFSTSADDEDLLFLSRELFEDEYDEAMVKEEAEILLAREREGREEVPKGAHKAEKHFNPNAATDTDANVDANTDADAVDNLDDRYLGIGYDVIIRKWWEMYNDGKEPVRSNRDVLTFELAVNLRHICGFDREVLGRVIPCYDDFPESQKMKCIDSALAERRTQMPKRLKDVLFALRQDAINEKNSELVAALDTMNAEEDLYHYERLPKLPQGVRDSVEAAGRSLAMPTLIAIAPAIGALATGMKLDVHGKARGLNLCSFIVGEFASGKGQIDDIIAAWMKELQMQTDVFTQQEDEWAMKTRCMKSGKTPEQPKLPVRMLTLNNTVANIAERLANTEGKHSFSFTPEADNVALKWRQSVSDFSVMLRQAYDEARYDREAKSADAVRVHIQKLLWNVTMCGTQDALYRVVTNYTDGLLSRLAIARTPDNTFAPLEEHPAQMTEKQSERIAEIAHLLPLLQGTVILPKLEERGRQWLEMIRMEAMKNDDRVLARQRFRGCVNAQRITVALWLPKVVERLIAKYGVNGAEKRLKEQPQLWIDTLRRIQTDDMMKLFDIIADYLIDNDLYYFRDRIEGAYEMKNNCVTTNSIRNRKGKNDSIFERLTEEFGFEQALEHSIAIKGGVATRNSVHQMLKNWKNQGLIVPIADGRWKKR